MITNENNVLLPAADVHLFLRDRETTDAARNLVNDWRFARVSVSIEEGDATTAIRSYQEAKSPDLVLIETDTIDDSFTAKLEDLSSFCQEGTRAVIIGPVNDVNLYRRLTSMGVSDYLVKPVLNPALSDIIAAALIDKLGTKGSHMISVLGAKGGVGTTTLAEFMAYGLSHTKKQKTFLLDAAGGWSTLGVGMGFEPTTSLAEATKAAIAQDADTFSRMLFKANERLSVLASGADPMLDMSVQVNEYEKLLDNVMIEHPYVVTDLSGANPVIKKQVINRSHSLVLVSTPMLPSLKLTRALIQEIKLIKGGDISSINLVINMFGVASSKEISKKDIADALDFKPNLFVNYNPALFYSLDNEGKKIHQSKEGQDIIAHLLSLIGEAPVVIEGKKSPVDSLMNMIRKK